MNYLYAAYAATWLIHVAYLGSIAIRYKRLQRDISNSGKK